MVRFYTSREIAKRLGINLARWKRWSREFLPPDPLGGLQSGYARQYNPNEAFAVFMAGYLVSALKFSIPEVRKIMQDLKDWLLTYGFYFKFSEKAQALKEPRMQADQFWIWIVPRMQNEIGFDYRIEATIHEKQIRQDDHPAVEKQSVSWVLDAESAAGTPDVMTGCRIVNISRLRAEFLNRLGIGTETES